LFNCIYIIFILAAAPGKAPVAGVQAEKAAAATKPKKEFYTVEEVAQHASSDDCWIIIEDKVSACACVVMMCACAVSALMVFVSRCTT
jgi:nitrate reductase (NAD(P)H)